MKPRSFAFLNAGILALVLSGCATAPQMNERILTDLYKEYRQAPKKNPIIFIPGMMGSVLEDKTTGQVVFGKIGKVFLNVLTLPITAPFTATQLITDQDNIIATQPIYKVTVIPRVIEKDIYDSVRRVAINAGGYTPDKDSFVLAYDWRKNLVEASQQLGALIERISKQYNDPDLKVDLLCHSAGGLVARYYVRYGTVDVTGRDPVPPPTYDGAGRVNKIIMLGTPNSGALESFRTLHKGELTGIGFLSPETIFTMPSSYQLLPPEGEPVFLDAAGKNLDVNLYDPANWEKYGWSIFAPDRLAAEKRRVIKQHGNKDGPAAYAELVDCQRRFLADVLSRTKRFHRALSQGSAEEEKQRVTYVLTGADVQPTLYRATLVRNGSGWETRFDTDTYGDGTVTRESLLGIRRGAAENTMRRLPSFYEVFIAANHMELPANPTYLDNILDMLLDCEPPAAASTRP